MEQGNGGREGGKKENIKVQEEKGSQNGNSWWQHSSQGYAQNGEALRFFIPGMESAASDPLRCMIAGVKSEWTEVEPRMGMESPCQPFGAAARKHRGKRHWWEIPKPGPHTGVGSLNLFILLACGKDHKLKLPWILTQKVRALSPAETNAKSIGLEHREV